MLDLLRPSGPPASVITQALQAAWLDGARTGLGAGLLVGLLVGAVLGYLLGRDRS